MLLYHTCQTPLISHHYSSPPSQKHPQAREAQPTTDISALFILPATTRAYLGNLISAHTRNISVTNSVFRKNDIIAKLTSLSRRGGNADMCLASISARQGDEKEENQAARTIYPVNTSFLAPTFCRYSSRSVPAKELGCCFPMTYAPEITESLSAFRASHSLVSFDPGQNPRLCLFPSFLTHHHPIYAPSPLPSARAPQTLLRHPHQA